MSDFWTLLYIEMIVFFGYLSAHILCVLVHVVRFNSKKPHPDVTEEERSHGCSSEAHTETGFR